MTAYVSSTYGIAAAVSTIELEGCEPDETTTTTTTTVPASTSTTTSTVKEKPAVLTPDSPAKYLSRRPRERWGGVGGRRAARARW